MRLLYINNNGSGFADYIDIEEGTAISEFFNQKMEDQEVHDYLIRVNRQPVPGDYILQENDRVTITPIKIDGARSVTSIN